MKKRTMWSAVFLALVFAVPVPGSASPGEITPRLGHVLGDPFPVPGDAAGFGFRLAAAGDIDGDGVVDMVVGAYIKDVGGNAAQGQAYVISGSDRSIFHVLNHPWPRAYAHFGGNVAGVGDITGDSVPDVAVEGEGLVHLFSGADGRLLDSLSRVPGAPPRGFGNPIEGIGDVDGDAVPDIAIGVKGEFVGPGQPQGVVHVYSGATRDLVYVVENPNPDPAVAQLFGEGIEALGDADGDLVPDFVVGAWQQMVDGLAQGRAFVISGVDGSVLYAISSQNPNPTWDATFGRHLAGLGDVDGDTIPDLAVGAVAQNVAGNELQGEVSVFSGADGAYLYTIDNPLPQAEALFGEAIAGLGDVDFDTVPDLIVGAPGQDQGNFEDAGRAFVISGRDGSLLATVDNHQPHDGSRFGLVIDTIGDADRDGAVDVIIAAPDQTVRGTPRSGRVIVYSLPLELGTPQCTISGTNGDDVLRGTDGPDVICGFGGDDRIYGLGGDDLLRGDDGADRIFGGPGRDIIQGNAGDDLLSGGDGDDRINGGPDADKLRGGPGDDVLDGFEGDDWVLGDDGDDIIRGSSDSDRLEGNMGSDIIFGGIHDDMIFGGQGNDTLIGNLGNDQIVGSAGNDTIRGGWGDDELQGGVGADKLFGNDGNDSVNGGYGRDHLRGGAGDDRLIGGEGNDVILGGAGDDVIEGNLGDDRLEGNQDDDWLSGHDGNDELFGGVGTDTCDGGAGSNTFAWCEIVR